jgi:hypothetical protein
LLRNSSAHGTVTFDNFLIFPKYFDVYMPFVDSETEAARTER